MEPKITPTHRRRIFRDALVIAVADGAVGISFGAVAVSAGLSVIQASLLSLLAFTGASQFALAGVVGSGGAPLTGAMSALLLGLRNGVYGLRLATILPRQRRAWRAHFVIDETTGMALAQPDANDGRHAFLVTGILLFTLWNIGTLIGTLGATFVTDPRRLGLDAAGPAVFAAFLAPQLKGRRHVIAALSAAVITVATVPLVPAGVPIVLVAVGVGIWAVTT